MNIRQRIFLFTAAAVLVATTSCGRAGSDGAATADATLPAAPPRRPNVVLISLDTVRPDHLGCYGYGLPTSPALDAFAAQATVFTQARSQAPWTLPSHLSLFTSLLPSHAGVEDIGQRLPETVPTFVELLAAAGYETAGLVNDGQMKALWGFARGFRQWREFSVDTPAGNCENLTREALAWLRQPHEQPFFLFLHYYDAHDPYEAPEPFRRRFGAELSGEQTRQLLWHHRFPGTDLGDQRLKAQLIAAYDAELAWLDAEVGKVLAALPANTLTVVFSDHGEAFEEHGWMTHGASLFDEELRVALLIRSPQPRGLRNDTPVMLLDVAPTILAQCGLAPSPRWEGRDLGPALTGGTIPARPQYAETTRVLEGLVLRAVIQPPAKAVCDLVTGKVACYRLSGDVPGEEVPELVKAVREYAAESDYWVLEAEGAGKHEVELRVEGGRLAVVVPLRMDPDTDQLQIGADRGSLTWACHLVDGVNGLYLQTAAPDATLNLGAKRDGQATPLFVRQADNQWQSLGEQPVRIEGAKIRASPVPAASSPVVGGVRLRYHRGTGRAPAAPARLDAETMRQLRALGYAQ